MIKVAIAIDAVVRVMRAGRPEHDLRVSSVVGERIILHDGDAVDTRSQIVTVVGYRSWRRDSDETALPEIR